MSEIRDNPALSRFELTSNGAMALVEYRPADNGIVLTHPKVPEVLSGQGIGSKLAWGVLDKLRAEGTKAISRCGFVARFIEQNPDYRNLVAMN